MRKHLMIKRLGALVALILCVGLMPTLSAENKPVLYRGQITRVYGDDSASYVYPTPDVLRPDASTKRIGVLKAGTGIEIVDVLPNYVEIKFGKGTGFVIRKRVENVVALDPAATPRYGTVVSRYYTTLDQEIHVKAAPDHNSETLITLQAGAMIPIIDVTDGWGQLIFKRQFGYVDTRLLPDLLMVAPSEDAGDEDTPIGVYGSFYNIATTDMNLNRIENLKVCSHRMDRVMQPGETLDFNNSVGPFNPGNGYLTSWGLRDGELVPSVGGGSCQVSSTLYNVVLQLTSLTVLARAPHGNDGAPYLPHGVDASSGGLNFIFRNDYDFPIRISSHVQDGMFFVAIYRLPA